MAAWSEEGLSSIEDGEERDLEFALRLAEEDPYGRNPHLQLTSRRHKEESRVQNSDNTLTVSLAHDGRSSVPDPDPLTCGCCFDEFEGFELVQCKDGHLFCCKCVRSYAEHSVFNEGSTGLRCMQDGCRYNFDEATIKRAVPEKIRRKFAENQTEAALRETAIHNLRRCPFCGYAAELDNNVRVFNCHKCEKDTCISCLKVWELHSDGACPEPEECDEETRLRKEYEERMSSLRIRTCHKCNAEYTKTDGCNRIMCTCKATMCYICRQPDITYDHFCEHSREPGKSCKKCKKCSMGTNPQEDEERAIAELNKQATVEQRQKGYRQKTVGAPEGV